jgi:heme exporter protein D
VSAFLSMGGYAPYVWPAYGVAAVVLLVLLASTLRDLRRRRAVLGHLEALRQPRQRPGPAAGARR